MTSHFYRQVLYDLKIQLSIALNCVTIGSSAFQTNPRNANGHELIVWAVLSWYFDHIASWMAEQILFILELAVPPSSLNLIVARFPSSAILPARACFPFFFSFWLCVLTESFPTGRWLFLAGSALCGAISGRALLQILLSSAFQSLMTLPRSPSSEEGGARTQKTTPGQRAADL